MIMNARENVNKTWQLQCQQMLFREAFTMTSTQCLRKKFHQSTEALSRVLQGPYFMPGVIENSQPTTTTCTCN